MTGAPFSWRALQRELQASPYLNPADDLGTQRGLVAAAMAILDRMSGDTGNVSWRPLRLVRKDQLQLQSALARAVAPESFLGGGAAVARPEPQPSPPRPGGAAAAVPVPGIAW